MRGPDVQAPSLVPTVSLCTCSSPRTEKAGSSASASAGGERTCTRRCHCPGSRQIHCFRPRCHSRPYAGGIYPGASRRAHGRARGRSVVQHPGICRYRTAAVADRRRLALISWRGQH